MHISKHTAFVFSVVISEAGVFPEELFLKPEHDHSLLQKGKRNVLLISVFSKILRQLFEIFLSFNII